jgi:hypothetical protein
VIGVLSDQDDDDNDGGRGRTFRFNNDRLALDQRLDAINASIQASALKIAQLTVSIEHDRQDRKRDDDATSRWRASMESRVCAIESQHLRDAAVIGARDKVFRVLIAILGVGAGGLLMAMVDFFRNGGR